MNAGSEPNYQKWCKTLTGCTNATELSGALKTVTYQMNVYGEIFGYSQTWILPVRKAYEKHPDKDAASMSSFQLMLEETKIDNISLVPVAEEYLHPAY